MSSSLDLGLSRGRPDDRLFSCGSRRPQNPVFSEPEQCALAAYTGLTREACMLALRQFAAWCRGCQGALLAAHRADIECFARTWRPGVVPDPPVPGGWPRSRISAGGRSDGAGWSRALTPQWNSQTPCDGKLRPALWRAAKLPRKTMTAEPWPGWWSQGSAAFLHG